MTSPDLWPAPDRQGPATSAAYAARARFAAESRIRLPDESGDFVSFAADGPHVYSCESTEPVRAMLAMRHPADSIANSANDSVILALTDQQSPDLTE